jgi:hypothetical protein
MKIEPMQIDDFLQIMRMNAEIYPEFAALPEEQKRLMANGNIVTGVAETYWQAGEIFGVGGIRHIGIGEGWMITPPGNRTPSLLRIVAQNFQKIREEQGLWRVYAESKISENFLKHLGFNPEPGTHVWAHK